MQVIPYLSLAFLRAIVLGLVNRLMNPRPTCTLAAIMRFVGLNKAANRPGRSDEVYPEETCNHDAIPDCPKQIV